MSSSHKLDFNRPTTWRSLQRQAKMPPKKDKKKDKKGVADDALSPIDTTSIQLIRPPLKPLTAPASVAPLPQRYEPTPIDMQTLLPEWSIDVVRNPTTWETSADEDGNQIPYTQPSSVGLPDTLTPTGVQWKRAAQVLPTPVYVPPTDDNEDDPKKKGGDKKDAKKKPEKGAGKKGKDGGGEVKVWEEVRASESRLLLLCSF